MCKEFEFLRITLNTNQMHMSSPSQALTPLRAAIFVLDAQTLCSRLLVRAKVAKPA